MTYKVKGEFLSTAYEPEHGTIQGHLDSGKDGSYAGHEPDLLGRERYELLVSANPGQPLSTLLRAIHGVRHRAWSH